MLARIKELELQIKLRKRDIEKVTKTQETLEGEVKA
jgi:hypothetical protein